MFAEKKAATGELIGAPDLQATPNTWVEELARGLEGTDYCVLHGWDSLAQGPDSDIDLVIEPGGLAVLERTLTKFGKVLQVLRYEASAWFFVVASDHKGNGPRLLQIDAITDYRHRGAVVLSGSQMLRNRSLWHGFWVAAPEVEAAYLMLKQAYKEVLPEVKRNRLLELCATLNGREKKIFARIFGPRWSRKLLDWIYSKDWSALETNLKPLWRAARRAAFRHDLLNPVRYWAPETARIWSRWRRVTGLFVVVLGPDGAGKSTLVSKLQDVTGQAFRRAEIFHWQPYCLFKPRFEGRVTEPHAQAPRSLALSLAKLVYHWLDYLFGYVLKIRPRLARSTLVLFDRYYHDLLVDRRRYRYGGPQWLVRAGRFLVPEPDLFLVLDVPVGELLVRKAELPAAELTRQREAYMRFAAQLSNTWVLDASKGAEEVAAAAREVLARFLWTRYRKNSHV